MKNIVQSQSLFYWNPFCNMETHHIIVCVISVAILILLESFLQYKKFCTIIRHDGVAILILLESFLQLREVNKYHLEHFRRNPYFIGILSAIGQEDCGFPPPQWVAILILLESFLQSKVNYYAKMER